ncbi:MAG: outer membrane beta-barrel protein [Daejeonella sp.]
MNEPEDDKITAKIRQVFENFEDASADHGWQELRKEYPAPARRPLLLWMSSAALVLVAFGLWFFNSTTSDGIMSNKQLRGGETKTASKSIIQDSGTVIKNHEDALAVTQKKSYPPSANRPATGVIGIPESAALSGEYKLDAQNKPLSLAKDPISQIPDEGIKSTWEYTKPDDRDSVLSVRAKMSLFTPSNSPESGSSVFPVENRTQSMKKSYNNKGLSLSFYAGTFFNYAEGSESNLNFGAGFSSDIRLSKNLKLSTGLNLANNKLDFDRNVPGNANKSFQNALSAGNTNNSTTAATLSNYKAELLSLDIPINIKYTPNPDKGDLYILAGLSSGTYLQEMYGAQLQTSSNSGSFLSVGQTQNERITKQLEHFDLARTLNVSFGFSTKLAKSQKITIEPFLKYPLGGLGTENIKFGSSGINIKLKINSSKR